MPAQRAAEGKGPSLDVPEHHRRRRETALTACKLGVASLAMVLLGPALPAHVPTTATAWAGPVAPGPVAAAVLAEHVGVGDDG